MPKTLALILAIAIIVLLVAIFMITFVINRKMKKPEGCNDIEINDNNCGACHNMDCSLKRKIELEAIKKELDEEEKK